MKILLDPQIFYTQNYGGISRIFAEFWSECNKRDDVELICPLFYSENLHLKENRLQPANLSFLHNKKYIGKPIVRAILKRVNKYNALSVIRKGKYDVFITSYYNDYFVVALHGKPYIVTVYDMIHEIFPNYFVGGTKFTANKQKLVEGAGAVVAISHSTKKDLLQFFPTISASKVSVVHLSESINTKETVKLKWLPENYILFIGKRETYKKFDTLYTAVLPLFKKSDNLVVLCAGGGNFTSEELSQFKNAGLTDKFIQYNFNDNELYTIYKNARLFVFPSEYEGFGIPALEAMASGCPLILSRSSSFPEIAEDAALYFEPNNAQQLGSLIEDLLSNKSLCDVMVQKGYVQVAKFSWKKLTGDYLTIASDLINKQ